jgi:superfamily II DNA or RNA helicase
MGIELRPYQHEAVAAIRTAYRVGGHRSVLFVLPTGGGKTVVFSHIAEQAAAKGNRIAILVHRVELLDQASRSLAALGVRHGLIAANRSMDLSAPVQVASVQTLARRLHRLPADLFQLLVVDEAHHSNAGTWAKVLAHFHRARVLGVTATPCRCDGRGLGEFYSEMILGPSPAELTAGGFLAPAKVYAPPIGFSAKGLRKRMGDFDLRDAAGQLGGTAIMGDAVGHYQRLLQNRTAIAFCCSIAHAEAVAAAFQSRGISASSIDGSMDAGTRRRLLEQLGSGELKVLTSCSLIGEGVDVPSVGGCLLLRPTQSLALHLQMIGRCLRPQEGKEAVILDHVGNIERLGHHLDEQEWTLDGVRKRQREAALSVRVCPSCFSALRSGTQQCPECGHQFAPQPREIVQVEGELRELERRERRAEQSSAQSFDDLVRIGHRRGMANPRGWARHVLAAREAKRGRSGPARVVA